VLWYWETKSVIQVAKTLAPGTRRTSSWRLVIKWWLLHFKETGSCHQNKRTVSIPTTGNV
jgi:hypothetical protein